MRCAGGAFPTRTTPSGETIRCRVRRHRLPRDRGSLPSAQRRTDPVLLTLARSHIRLANWRLGVIPRAWSPSAAHPATAWRSGSAPSARRCGCSARRSVTAGPCGAPTGRGEPPPLRRFCCERAISGITGGEQTGNDLKAEISPDQRGIAAFRTLVKNAARRFLGVSPREARCLGGTKSHPGRTRVDPR